MMQLYDDNNTTSKRMGAIAVALYVALFGALCLWGGFSMELPNEQGGMLVDFGTTELAGQGEEDTALADDYVLPEPKNVPEVEAVEVQEAPEPEAPEVEEGHLVVDKKVEEAAEEKAEETEPEQPKEEEKPREVNRRALFPGNRPDSPSPSQGVTDSLAGNQGYIGGSQSDNYEGSGGEGGFEPDWNLEGRRPRTEFPRPKYADNEQGIVVVEIWVNSAGDVTGAAYRAVGSTVSAKSHLVSEAIKAAKGVKFDQSEQDLQVGTITYNFRLDTGARR